ncbi:MAG: hypothetical protein MHM6MM_003717 [Cercozoa sp. M6MM]
MRSLRSLSTRVGVRMQSTRVLITGAGGQIGCELVPYLRDRYGADNVVASDLRVPDNAEGTYEACDVTDAARLAELAKEYRVTKILHLASLLSGVGEQQPQLALKVGARGTENVLELGRELGVQVFIPSSIAAFGPSTPRVMTPNETITRPTTVYGVTKVYAELLGEYYHRRFGVDFRSLRYPGIISTEAMPGGGTTDYAVEVFHEALLKGRYECYLEKDTEMPMMFMNDTIEGTVQFLEADSGALGERRCYNVTGMSFTPQELFEALQERLPNFEYSYKPDFRQAIADTWPKSLDDSAAREDWHYKPEYDVGKLCDAMLKRLRERYDGQCVM